MQNSNDYREIPKKIHQILSDFFRISLSKFKILQKFLKIPKKMRRNFAENFEFRAVQRIANLVDLEKRCKMSIWVQKSALIQPRTSFSKFA